MDYYLGDFFLIARSIKEGTEREHITHSKQISYVRNYVRSTPVTAANSDVSQVLVQK